MGLVDFAMFWLARILVSFVVIIVGLVGVVVLLSRLNTPNNETGGTE